MIQDFLDLLKLFNQGKVRYLVVGGYAVGVHSEVRATKDLDIWVNPEIQNARRVYRALMKFGAPLANLKPADFTDRRSFYMMGIEPNRIDIIMALKGVNFNQCWKHRLRARVEGIKVNFISRAHLLRNKLMVGRTQDLADAEKLREAGLHDIKSQKKPLQAKKRLTRPPPPRG